MGIPETVREVLKALQAEMNNRGDNADAPPETLELLDVQRTSSVTFDQPPSELARSLFSSWRIPQPAAPPPPLPKQAPGPRQRPAKPRAAQSISFVGTTSPAPAANAAQESIEAAAPADPGYAARSTE